MSIRKSLLAAASVMALAFAAMPAAASAITLDPPGGSFPAAFTTSGGTGTLRSSAGTVTCTTNTGSGSFENATTGTIQFTFHGCKGPLSVNCTTSGQATGTITTTVLPFHLVTVNGKAAVLITSNAGHFATFNCSIKKIVVEGNGVIGTITSPPFGEESSTFTVDFNASGTTQEDMTIDGSATEYSLTVEGAAASEEAEGTGTFTGGKAIITK